MLNIRNDCVWVFFFLINAIFFKPYTVFTVACWGGGGGGVGCKIILVFDQF